VLRELVPQGKDWGPRFGPCQVPGWKDEHSGLTDAEGHSRPNWTVYGTFSLGTKYDFDPDTRSFVFYAGGHTFRYDPCERSWKDLNPRTHPEKELGGILLWGSMCYDWHNKRFVLFGGGNVQSERGDPGTWTYTPATKAWEQLRLDVQPPQRANSRLVYDREAKKVSLFGGDALNHLLADTWGFDVAGAAPAAAVALAAGRQRPGDGGQAGEQARQSHGASPPAGGNPATGDNRRPARLSGLSRRGPRSPRGRPAPRWHRWSPGAAGSSRTCRW
jgi:hypothetical protein